MEKALIIPILPDTGGVQALIDSRRDYPVQRLAQMPLEELRALQHAWYGEAVKQNVITTLHVIIRGLGQLDLARGLYEWRATINTLNIEARSTCGSSSTLRIEINNQRVCTNEVLGEELFKPGPWLQAVIVCFEQAQIKKQRQAEREEMDQKQSLIDSLGGDV